MIRMYCFHCGGLSSVLGQGIILQVVWPKCRKKKIDTKKSSIYIQFKSSKNETILFKDAY